MRGPTYPSSNNTPSFRALPSEIPSTKGHLVSTSEFLEKFVQPITEYLSWSKLTLWELWTESSLWEFVLFFLGRSLCSYFSFLRIKLQPLKSWVEQQADFQIIELTLYRTCTLYKIYLTIKLYFIRDLSIFSKTTFLKWFISLQITKWFFKDIIYKRMNICTTVPFYTDLYCDVL